MLVPSGILLLPVVRGREPLMLKSILTTSTKACGATSLVIPRHLTLVLTPSRVLEKRKETAHGRALHGVKGVFCPMARLFSPPRKCLVTL